MTQTALLLRSDMEMERGRFSSLPERPLPFPQDLSLGGEDKSWRSNEMEGETQEKETERVGISKSQDAFPTLLYPRKAIHERTTHGA